MGWRKDYVELAREHTSENAVRVAELLAIHADETQRVRVERGLLADSKLGRNGVDSALRELELAGLLLGLIVASRWVQVGLVTTPLRRREVADAVREDVTASAGGVHRLVTVFVAVLAVMFGGTMVPVPAFAGDEPAKVFHVQTDKPGRYAYTGLESAGTVELSFTLPKRSGYPSGVMMAVGVACQSGGGGYGATYNVAQGETLRRTVPFSGVGCNMRVATKQSDRWPLPSVVKVSAMPPVYVEEPGELVQHKAEWVSEPVVTSNEFSFGRWDGLEGWVSVKATSCTSMGGTTDPTRKFGCTGLVRPRLESTSLVTVRDDRGVMLREKWTITPRRHHDVLTRELPRPVEGELKVQVTRLAGSAMLVHGPGSSLVGYIPDSAPVATPTPTQEPTPVPAPTSQPTDTPVPAPTTQPRPRVVEPVVNVDVQTPVTINRGGSNVRERVEFEHDGCVERRVEGRNYSVTYRSGVTVNVNGASVQYTEAA